MAFVISHVSKLSVQCSKSVQEQKARAQGWFWLSADNTSDMKNYMLWKKNQFNVLILWRGFLGSKSSKWENVTSVKKSFYQMSKTRRKTTVSINTPANLLTLQDGDKGTSP